MSVRSPLFPVGLLAVLLLAACSAPSPDPTPAITIGGDAAETPSDTTDDQPPGGAGPVRADGMPELPLEGCGELVEAETDETDFDTQWSFEYACTARDAFDASVAALDSLGTLSHPQSAVLGDEAYISDRHHFIGEWDGRVLDVDLELTGAPDDLEVVYLVTLRKPE